MVYSKNSSPPRSNSKPLLATFSCAQGAIPMYFQGVGLDINTLHHDGAHSDTARRAHADAQPCDNVLKSCNATCSKHHTYILATAYLEWYISLCKYLCVSMCFHHFRLLTPPPPAPPRTS